MGEGESLQGGGGRIEGHSDDHHHHHNLDRQSLINMKKVLPLHTHNLMGAGAGSDRFSPSPFVSTEPAGASRDLHGHEHTRPPDTPGNPGPATSVPAGLQPPLPWPRAPPHASLPRPLSLERPLIVLAMRVATLEKTASNIGALSFLWATVVLLGGYASSMKMEDFWIVTTILVSEGFRIFSRSHELELQHQYTSSGSATVLVVTQAYHSLGRAFSTLVSPRGHPYPPAKPPHAPPRDSSPAQFSILPFLHFLFQAHRVSLFLYCLQLVSALVCVGLSTWRLVQHDYLTPDENDHQYTHRSSLFIFYTLTVTEAAIFLVGRAYWQYQISILQILKMTNVRCMFNHHDPDGHTVRRFFYDVYSTCLSQSIFDGLKMSLTGYALKWIQSDGPEAHREHLLGLQALYAMVVAQPPDHANFVLAAHLDHRRQATLRAISTSSQGAVERLLEMITWKNEDHRSIRNIAAMLLSKLVMNDVAGVRVGAISGSMDVISGLLSPEEMRERHSDLELVNMDHALSSEAMDMISGQPIDIDPGSHGIAVPHANPTVPNHGMLCVQLGLRIFIKLAYKNETICSQIGATRGLLNKLVSFINISDIERNGDIMVLWLSLQLINDLTACNGLAGKVLRQDIAKVVLSISRLRDILDKESLINTDDGCGTNIDRTLKANSSMSGEKDSVELLKLKLLAVDTLSNLALDEEVRQDIGRTGGIMYSLFRLFFGMDDLDDHGTEPCSDSSASAPMHHRDGMMIDASTRSQDMHNLRVRIATTAGKALALLSLPSSTSSNLPSRNCARMLCVRPQEIMEAHQFTRFNSRLRQRSSSSSSSSSANYNASMNDSTVRNRASILDALIYGIGNYKLDKRGQHALFILRNFFDDHNNYYQCEGGPEGYRLRIATSITPELLGWAMDPAVGLRIKEAAIGLAAKTVLTLRDGSGRSTSTSASRFLAEAFEKAGTNKEGFVEMLVEMLKAHEDQSSAVTKVPRLRRFCVELAISLAEVDDSFVPLFHVHSFGACLRRISTSMSDLENFATFSGMVGLSLHNTTMEELLLVATHKLRLQDQLYI